MTHRNLVTIIGLVFSLLLVSVISFSLLDYRGDDAYVTFRHAKNLIQGNGFVFNPGDRLLSTTSPLHGLVLALLGCLFGDNLIPQLAIGLSTISMIILCVSVFCVFGYSRLWYAGLASVFFIATQHWLYRFYPLETVMTLALNLVTVALVIRRKWTLAGTTAGLAIVARADAILLILALVILVLIVDRPSIADLMKFCFICGAVGLLWFSFALIYYGSLFPNTLAAKSGFNQFTYVSHIWPKILTHLVLNQPFLSAIAVMLGLIGCVVLIMQRSILLVLPFWGIMHSIGYTLIGIPYPFSWYYAPLILMCVVLACIGGGALVKLVTERDFFSTRFGNIFGHSIPIIGILCFSFFSFSTVFSFATSYQTEYWGGARDSVYHQVALWIKQNTDPTARIAILEAGTIGYYSDRNIVDLAGLVTYELRDLPKLGAWTQTIELLNPEYVVGVRGLPPDPNLTGLEGYTVVASFPKNGETNLFEDIVIYEKSPSNSQ